MYQSTVEGRGDLRGGGGYWKNIVKKCFKTEKAQKMGN